MWVGGIGVSGGYLNLPEKTAERWKPDPFLGNGSMMFNTGDLGRWRKDGQLDHLGRADDQVKVKGFRVELDGVAAAMRTHEPVRNAVALLVGTELWGFITPFTVDLSLVRNATAKVQPYYAVPSQYLAIDDFPMTKNGKVDKRALVSLAESDNCGGQKRLSVRNGGVPFNPNLPGTPNSINEQPSFKWGRPGNASPPSPDSLSLSSVNDSTDNSTDNSTDTESPADRGQSASEGESGSPFVLDDVPRMVTPTPLWLWSPLSVGFRKSFWLVAKTLLDNFRLRDFA
jgi:hypothetical protein